MKALAWTLLQPGPEVGVVISTLWSALVAPAAACSIDTAWSPSISSSIVPPSGAMLPARPVIRWVASPLEPRPIDFTVTLADEDGAVVQTWVDPGEELVVAEPLIDGRAYTLTASDGQTATWVVGDVPDLPEVEIGEGSLSYGTVRCPPSNPSVGSASLEIRGATPYAVYELRGGGSPVYTWPGADLAPTAGWVDGGSTSRMPSCWTVLARHVTGAEDESVEVCLPTSGTGCSTTSAAAVGWSVALIAVLRRRGRTSAG